MYNHGTLTLDELQVERAKCHDLLDLVTFALCTVICAADGWVEIEEFGRAKQVWFASFLALPGGVPSHDTVGLVFAALDSIGTASRRVSVDE